METTQLTRSKRHDVQMMELADAHCHLDMIDESTIRADISKGVRIMITNGVNTSSNMRVMELADGKNIFAAIGIDPEHALSSSEEELDFTIGIIRSNIARITAIGEIGLDYKEAGNPEDIAKQKLFFERFLDTARENDLPVSVHARSAIDDVIELLHDHGIERAQMHYFEGDETQAKLLDRYGYMISIPPIESGKRKRAIKALPLELIMTESDAPVVGKSPISVMKSVEFIAKAKSITVEEAAHATVANAKRFFRIRL